MPKRGGSKGRKKPSLRDLSRQMPTPEEFEKLIHSLDSMDARAASLVLCSLLDNLLELAIVENFVALDADAFDALFRNPSAPLAAFSSKITLSRALGIYGADFKSYLDRMRAIRNTFAHTTLPYDFDTPLIRDVCNTLNPAELSATGYQPNTNSSRERFLACGTMMATHLVRVIHAHRVAKKTSGPRPTFPDKFFLRHPRTADDPN